MPPRAIDRRDLPVIINFHGGGDHGANERKYSLMDRLADRETFIAVYPNGTGRLSARLLTWNAGTCCGYAALNRVDDVGFTRALIGKLAESVSMDRRRIYATGLSNGAMMSYRLAAEAGDLIAAVAPVAGGMRSNRRARFPCCISTAWTIRARCITAAWVCRFRSHTAGFFIPTSTR